MGPGRDIFRLETYDQCSGSGNHTGPLLIIHIDDLGEKVICMVSKFVLDILLNVSSLSGEGMLGPGAKNSWRNCFLLQVSTACGVYTLRFDHQDSYHYIIFSFGAH